MSKLGMAKEMGQCYSMDWREFNPAARIALLKEANVHLLDYYPGDDVDKTPYFFIPDHGYSSTQREVIEFVQSPTKPVKFYNFDTRLGKAVLEIHTAFWQYFFDR